MMRFKFRKMFLIFNYAFFLTILCIFILHTISYCQNQKIKFERISLDQGLSQSSIFCILQDRKGFLWFGTEDGLNRYDGYIFKTYKHDPEDPNSLGPNWIMALYEDRSGVIWIGTLGGGLHSFDREKEKFTAYKNNPDDPFSLSDDRVYEICEDNYGTLWIGTRAGGLNKFDKKSRKFIRYIHDPKDHTSLAHNFVQAIHEDYLGNLWIGTNGGGLDKFDRKNESFIHYKHDRNNHTFLGDSLVRSICEGQTGELWIGTSKGLCKYDIYQDEFTQYQYKLKNQNVNNIMSVWVDLSDGVYNIWCGTEGGGLLKFDANNKTYTHYEHKSTDPNSISNNRIYSIYEDRSGIVWIGTRVGGLNRFNNTRKKFIHYFKNSEDSHSISSNSVFPIFEDNSGTIWIGTAGGGLNRFDIKTKQFLHFKHNPDNSKSIQSNFVWAIECDRSGNLWLGTRKGLSMFDVNRKQFKNLPLNQILTLYIDSFGIIWLGMETGIQLFDPSTGEIINHYQNEPQNQNTLSDNYINCIVEGKSGVIWIGTQNGGINRFDRKKNEFVRLETQKRGSPNIQIKNVYYIHESYNNAMWIGTVNLGLCHLDSETGDFINFTEKDGLPNNTIYGILEDDHGNLWLSTNKGISKFNPQNKTFRNYDITDGLQENEFNQISFCKLQNGEMLFGGINGITHFHPDSIRDNQYVPPVVITDFQIFNQQVPIGKSINGDVKLNKSITESKNLKLSYKDRVISFEFAGLHYVSPEKNEYAYIMEGFEKDWNYVGNRHFATYTNLPAANYIFKVKAANSDGVWNEQGTSIAITVTPPYWQTWWFRILMISLILIIAFSWYKARIRNIEIQKKKLEKQVEERTYEVMQQQEELKTQAEHLEQVNKELEKLSLVASKTENSIVIMDAEANFEWFNDGFTRLHGYTLSEYIEKKGRNLVSSSMHPEIKNTINKCITEKKPVIYQSNNISKNGENFWTQITLTPILNDSGNIEKLVTIEADIRKLKDAEKEIINKSKEISEKNEQIMSSIRYAVRIQQAILPTAEKIKSNIPNHFVIYKPKDIVSGDFYWFNKIRNKIYVAVVDCTGHGVPGAFMSMIGNSLLNKIITEKYIFNPAEILENLHYEVRKALKQGIGSSNTDDGMDVCLCRLESGKNELTFAGAKRPLFITQNGNSRNGIFEIIEIKGDRKSVGGRQREKKRIFTDHKIGVHKNDMIYLTTDGYVDQNNGENKKYGVKQLKKLLKNISKLDVAEQEKKMINDLENHMENMHQRDDITMVGIRI